MRQSTEKLSRQTNGPEMCQCQKQNKKTNNLSMPPRSPPHHRPCLHPAFAPEKQYSSMICRIHITYCCLHYPFKLDSHIYQTSLKGQSFWHKDGTGVPPRTHHLAKNWMCPKILWIYYTSINSHRFGQHLKLTMWDCQSFVAKKKWEMNAQIKLSIPLKSLHWVHRCIESQLLINGKKTKKK